MSSEYVVSRSIFLEQFRFSVKNSNTWQLKHTGGRVFGFQILS